MLEKLMTADSVTVIAPDGSRQEGVRCQFKPPTVIIPDESVDIGDGFLLEHTLPNGRVESYVVEQIQLYANNPAGIPTFYELRVRKNIPKAVTSAGQVIYNVSGTNARLNIGSSDSSINVAQVEVHTLFQRMKLTAAEIPEAKLREEVLAAIDDMESSSGDEGFTAAYRKFIAVVADHLSVFGPFLPALAQLLVR